jgi:hypothetical protein
MVVGKVEATSSATLDRIFCAIAFPSILIVIVVNLPD